MMRKKQEKNRKAKKCILAVLLALSVVFGFLLLTTNFDDALTGFSSLNVSTGNEQAQEQLTKKETALYIVGGLIVVLLVVYWLFLRQY